MKLLTRSTMRTHSSSESAPVVAPPPPWWVVDPTTAHVDAAIASFTAEERVLAERLDRQTRLGHFQIPQVPEIALRVMALLGRADATAAELADLVHRDQQLAADILNFANSPLLQGTTRVTTISAAIMRAGFRRTRSLVFAASLRALVFSGREVPRANALWRHALAAATAAATMAGNLRCDKDELYLAGLFHDVGKTVVLAMLDTTALRSNCSAPRAAFIDHVLEVHHERVGAEVALQWDLPDDVFDAIQHHAGTTDLPLSKVQAIVAVADIAARRLGHGEPDDGRPIAGPNALAALGITSEDLPRILEGVPAAIDAVLAT